MTAPIVTPGGGPQPPLGPAKAGGRRDEPAPGDGTFAALLAALAPAPAQPAAPSGPALPGAPDGEAVAGLTNPLQALFGQARETGGQPALPVPLTTPGEAGVAPDGPEAPAPAAEIGLQVEPMAEEPVQVKQTVRYELADVPPLQGQEVPEGASGPSRSAESPQRDTAQPVQDGPAGLVAVPGDEAPVQASAGSAGQPGSGTLAGEEPGPSVTTGNPDGEAVSPDARAVADDGPSAGEGRPLEAASRPAPDVVPASGPDSAPGAEPATEPAARGLERLTAGRLQAEQVIAELSRAVPELRDGEYRVTLRLHPEHLGEVRLELHLSGREIHATLEVANQDARQALESRGDQLRQSLSDAGYNLAGFEVATGEGRQPRRGTQEDPYSGPQPTGRSRLTAENGPAAGSGTVRPIGPRGGRLDTLA